MTELAEVLRTTGSVREFRPDPVPDEVLYRILDSARFAPSGGNRQGWRVVVVKDAPTRRALRDAYLPGWYAYLAQSKAGLVAFSPLNDPDDEARAEASSKKPAEQKTTVREGFAEHLDEVPALLAVLVDLAEVAATDRDLARTGIVGGASVYPFIWSVLLSARVEGLAGVMTTMAVREEQRVKDLLEAPEGWALASLVALGYPVRAPRRLKRAAVEEFTTIDRANGPSFAPR